MQSIVIFTIHGIFLVGHNNNNNNKDDDISKLMANCDSCNAVACRTVGGSCTSGSIFGINCTQNLQFFS